MLPYSITTGVSSVLETLVSQAYGSNHNQLCGKYLNQHLFLITIIFGPVALTLYNSKMLLTALSQNSEAATYCQYYLRSVLPALYFDMVILSLTIYLTAMERTLVPMMIQISQILMHLTYTHLTQKVMGLGFSGLSIATNCTRLTTLMLFLIYFSVKKWKWWGRSESQFFK